MVTGVWVPLTCLSSVNSGSDGRGCWPPCWQGRSSSQHRNSRNLSRCLSADAPPVRLHLWDDFLVNNILVLVRFYIHKSKYFKAKPSFYVFHNELISYTLSFLNYCYCLFFYFLLHLILLLCRVLFQVMLSKLWSSSSCNMLKCDKMLYWLHTHTRSILLWNNVKNLKNIT